MKGEDMTGIGIPELIVLVVLVGIFTIPFWIWAIINIVRSDFRDNGKIVWLLVVILLYTLGVVLYAFIGRKQKIKRPG
jgi:predicted membrane channel-forming protein YqfA (hemolysin III family)